MLTTSNLLRVRTRQAGYSQQFTWLPPPCRFLRTWIGRLVPLRGPHNRTLQADLHGIQVLICFREFAGADAGRSRRPEKRVCAPLASLRTILVPAEIPRHAYPRLSWAHRSALRGVILRSFRFAKNQLIRNYGAFLSRYTGLHRAYILRISCQVVC